MSEHHHTKPALTHLSLDIEPKPAPYINAARRIDSWAGEDLRPVRVSVLSSFTAEILRPYIVVEGARRGMHVRLHFCPFNQIEIQALNPTSELYKSQPDVIVIALQLEDIAPNVVWRYAGLSTAEVEIALAELQQRVESLLVHLRQNSNAVILLFNFALPPILDAGLADAGMEISQTSTFCRANEILSRLCRTQSAAYVFDYHRLVAEHGLCRWYDNKLLYMAKVPFSTEAQLALGRRIARYLRAIIYPCCKCLVLDIDNTLWGGVLGEDGLEGIALGEDYPGNIYKQFQRRLLSLRDQGILLAIASKNNEQDVIGAMQHHPDMLLQYDHFAATQIHWGDKVASLRAIAQELNIGLDALAFFDDSPVERALVRQYLPEVIVIETRANPLDYVQALEESSLFDRLILSDDDRKRANMMQESRLRQQFYTEARSVDDFLRSLEMIATIGEVGSSSLARVAQLLAKTNQFTLTTRRHTGAQLKTLIEQGTIALWMRLRDRFGDNGLVGVAIGVPDTNGHWRVDSFLLSCRVIGRQAETVLLGLLAQYASERGCKVLVGEYVASAKNSQVANFYPSYGFHALDNDGRHWALDLTKAKIALPSFIQVEYEKK
jgi:FkbH-like protein